DMNEWQTVQLGNVLEYIVDNRGKTPPFTEEKNDFELIEINAIVGDKKAPDYSEIKKFVSMETFNTWFRKGHPKRGDVLFSTVGSIAEVAYINEERGCIAQNLIALRSKKELMLGEF